MAWRVICYATVGTDLFHSFPGYYDSLTMTWEKEGRVGGPAHGPGEREWESGCTCGQAQRLRRGHDPALALSQLSLTRSRRGTRPPLPPSSLTPLSYSSSKSTHYRCVSINSAKGVRSRERGKKRSNKLLQFILMVLIQNRLAYCRRSFPQWWLWLSGFCWIVIYLALEDLNDCNEMKPTTHERWIKTYDSFFWERVEKKKLFEQSFYNPWDHNNELLLRYLFKLTFFIQSEKIS